MNVAAKALVGTLTEQTAMLKEEYLAKSEEYAKAEHDTIMERNGWKEAEYCEYFQIEPVWVNSRCAKADGPTVPGDFLSFPRGFYNTPVRNASGVMVNYKKYDRMRDEVRKAKRIGLAGWIEVELTRAEKKYHQSIEKLAARIEKKGLNQDAIQIETARVGVNIETTLTDGERTVRAWTIIAEGPMVRPHYRYLIK